MKLQDQVCTLEQAKRLKELGIEHSSLFEWWWYLTGHEPELNYGKASLGPNLSNLQTAAAFTVAELGVMLPEFVALDELGTLIIHKGVTTKEHKKWSCHYFGLTKKVVDAVFGYSQRDVMAKMLIHLLETNLINAEEVNARLAA